MAKRKCTKSVSYPSKKVALHGLRSHKVRLTGVAPLRVYWCGQHKAYHTTSKVRY